MSEQEQQLASGSSSSVSKKDPWAIYKLKFDEDDEDEQEIEHKELIEEMRRQTTRTIEQSIGLLIHNADEKTKTKED